MSYPRMRFFPLMILAIVSLRCAAGISGESREGAPCGIPKLSSAVHGLVTAPDRAAYARARGIPLPEGRVRIVILLDRPADSSEGKRLSGRYGLVPEKSGGNLLRALAPVDALIPLSGDAAVLFIDLPDKPGI